MELCEIKERLLREYSHRIEMHAHTSPGSLCGRVPVRQRAARFFLQRAREKKVQTTI